MRNLLIVVLLLGVGALLWREWEKQRRPAEAAGQGGGEVTPVLRMTRSEDGTGIIVRVVRSNSAPMVLTNGISRQSSAATNGTLPGASSSNKAPVYMREVSSSFGGYPRAVTNIFEAQVVLDRINISPGTIDGVAGAQTHRALRVFQVLRGLAASGELDPATQARLMLSAPAVTNYLVTAADLAGLGPVSTSWMGKATQSSLEHETLLERLAERHHASQTSLRRLNPRVDWERAKEGTRILLPAICSNGVPEKAAALVVSLGEKTIRVLDDGTKLMAFFPCTIAKEMGKRPVGELKVVSVVPNPNYTFDPQIFPESPEAQAIDTKLVIPPGPNNPVGVAWIGLDRPGYGIHGAPIPEQVGRTESHGCFRLANWNAERLLQMVWVGMPVQVIP